MRGSKREFFMAFVILIVAFNVPGWVLDYLLYPTFVWSSLSVAVHLTSIPVALFGARVYPPYLESRRAEGLADL